MYYSFNSSTDHTNPSLSISLGYCVSLIEDQVPSEVSPAMKHKMEGVSYTSMFPLSCITCAFSNNYMYLISKGKVDGVSELLERTQS